ncbi:MAG: efflux RND transporter periplasmic adaptor subunit [Flavobacteriales bacterium]|nr:efflux RND transporter periplasmic adaptor subunit [Flavobacteriales bacterium]
MMFRQALLLSIVVLLAACQEKRVTTKPTVGPITAAVYASGVVKARDQYQAFAALNGLVAHVHVAAGDSVRKGDALFTIDDRASNLGSERAELTVDLMRQNAGPDSPVLAQLRLAMDQARTRMSNDSLMLARQRALWDKQVGSKVELDNRELAYTSSRNAFGSAVKAYDETRTRLRNELRVAENELALRRAAEGDHTVRSLIDGRVYDVLIERGELATTQRPLAIVGRYDSFLIELQVDEFDIVRVLPGQNVWVTMDSYKQRAFEATVTRVDPLMNERTRTFTVEAVFVEPPPVLYPNLTLEANIVIERKESALTVPAEYLVQDRYVLVASDERREVVIGLRDLQRVEVLKGLDTTVTLYHP